MIHVTTDQVAALADTIDNKNTNIADAAQEAIDAINSLSASWDGAASEAVIPLFNSIKSNCIDAQRQIVADYANFLRLRVASGYEQVENNNKSLSELFK